MPPRAEVAEPVARTSALLARLKPFVPEGVNPVVHAVATTRPRRLGRMTERDLSDARTRENMIQLAQIDAQGTRSIIAVDSRFDQLYARLRSQGADTSERDAKRAAERPTQQSELEGATDRVSAAVTWRDKGLPGAADARRVEDYRQAKGRRGRLVLGLLPGALVAGLGLNFVLGHAQNQDTGSKSNGITQTITENVGAPDQARSTSTNSYSRTFELSPAQRAANVRADTPAATAFVNRLKKFAVKDGDTIKSVTVIGSSSPETANPHQDLTQENNGDTHLARERAADGKKALVKVLHNTPGINVRASSIDTVGIDRTLNPGEEQTVEVIARSHHITPNQVIEEFSGSSKSTLGPEARQVDAIVSPKRGIEYSAILEKKPHSHGIVSKIKEGNIDGIPLEPLIYALIIAKSGAASAYVLFDSLTGRLARGRARSEMKKMIKRQKKAK